MNNTTKYYSLIIAVVVLFAMMTVSCEKSPEDNGNGTDETNRMIDIRTSIEALTKSPALDGNGEGNFSISPTGISLRLWFREAVSRI